MLEITEGTIHVFVYRTGLMSAVGHDLRLSLQRFRLECDDGEVTGRFWPESFEVDGAVRDGEVIADALSASDRKRIRKNTREDVLETHSHPELRFEGQYERADDGVYDVAGELEMVGVWETVRATVRRQGDRLQSAVELTPSRWGIEPYRAMLGALRLEDEVRIEFDLRADGEL